MTRILIVTHALGCANRMRLRVDGATHPFDAKQASLVGRTSASIPHRRSVALTATAHQSQANTAMKNKSAPIFQVKVKLVPQNVRRI